MLPRLLTVTISAVSVAIVTAVQLNLPNNSFWAGLRPLQYFAIGGLLMVAVVEMYMSVLDRVQLPAVRQFDQNLRAVLSAGISQLAHKSAVDWRDIGVSAYHLRSGLRGRKLVLVDSLRMGAGLKLATRWRRDQGVVGAAYTKQQLVAIDWESYFKSAESAGPSAWQAKPRSECFGLTWGELMRTKALTGVAAAPVWDEGANLTGVVCVEAPADLSGQDVGSTVQDIAAAVGDLGAPPASWWNYVGRRVA